MRRAEPAARGRHRVPGLYPITWTKHTVNVHGTLVVLSKQEKEDS